MIFSNKPCPGVTGKAVIHRLAKLRSMAKEVQSEKNPAPAVAKPRAKKGEGKSTKTVGKGGKGKASKAAMSTDKITSEEDDDNEQDAEMDKTVKNEITDENTAPTTNGAESTGTIENMGQQKVLTGRVTKGRNSSRQSKKVNYKKLANPMAGVGSDAEDLQMDLKEEKSSSEDSADSDEDYAEKDIKAEA